ncbi:hypothetical protein CGLO_12881 [Colletotrichum gloeosporioides Cg-14]|uniref:Uncharacterized protein n=1 Tax=Colletotrichum gloeosporioides (strain Cg-14) TaxID=1237896 RepID=T0JXQ4_COLGC|nr:hypothetical protein CGLO_12881 [Colletotrichum gloeosporioides Cg-14]
MEFAIVIGIGERAETVDCHDFAKAALSRVSSTALNLALQRRSSVAGRLATELYIARQALGSIDSSKLQRRVPKLLSDLERICAWPKSSQNMAMIHALVNNRDQKVEIRVQRGILCFANSSQNVIDQYFHKLARFSKEALDEDDIRGATDKAESTVTTDEYPVHVNTELYTILKSHSLCTCIPGHAYSHARHHARLRLLDGISKVDESVAFDMLFSESPTTCHHWQDLQLRVPLRKKAAKAVKFDTKDSCQSAFSSPRKSDKKIKADKTMAVVKPDEFCNLVKARLGSRICCHIQDSELHRLYRGFPLVQKVDSGESLSLRHLLRIGRLSNRMKLILAYIVARSFWQYYDSPWMDSPWTSDSVHFLRELPSEEETYSRGALYASKPYLAVEFKELNGDFFEYCNAPSVIFPYPRLLSLCIILLEIGRGQSLPIKNSGSLVADLNERWHLAKQVTDANKSQNEFDYPHYRKAIVRCLNNSSWEQNSESIEEDVFTRKSVIHNVIVRPLEKLLGDLGFSENLHVMTPVDEVGGPSTVPDVPAPPPMPTISSDVDQSDRWLHKMKIINQCFQRKESSTFTQAPRIAILDTGYDSGSNFFSLAGRSRRVKGWKDFVESQEDPIDEEGHGTHTIATAMKAAPFASIYVARIAKDRGGLKNAHQAIVKAIDWAANDARVDIVSMSFGFKNEDPSITDALRKALYDRHGNLIFFAAASNSGANGGEMFPANLDDVFSVRETDALGAFSDTNPPVDPDAPVVFGTLGRQVPSAWLSNVDGEVAKSGSSVATAVAAGIGALLMTITDIGVANHCLTVADSSKMRTKRGMYQVLKRMSRDMGNRCRYICPEEILVDGDAKKTWTAIADAFARS